MALAAAGLRNASMPGLATLRSFRRYVEFVRCVAVITNGPCETRHILVLDSVEGRFVGFDVFGDQFQSWLISGGAVLLRLFPQVLVAIGTTGLGHVFVKLVVFLGVYHVGVAVHTLQAAVHTLGKFVDIYAPQFALVILSVDDHGHLDFFLLAIVALQAGVSVKFRVLSRTWRGQSRTPKSKEQTDKEANRPEHGSERVH